jgi:hypothetical protein
VANYLLGDNKSGMSAGDGANITPASLGIPQTASFASSDGGPDTIMVRLSEDASQGDAQFTLSVDGMVQGAAQAMTALHDDGAWQDFTFTGQFGPGDHAISMNFLNDLGGATPDTNRNLHVDSVQMNGMALATPTTMWSADALSFQTHT